MKQEEAAPNKEEAVKTIPDSELDDSAVEVVEVSFFKGVEYDSRTGLPWGMTQEQFDTNNAASRDSAKRIKSIEEEEHEAQSSVSKESDAYNKGIIRKAAAWRKKFNPKVPPHLLGFHQLNRDGIACNGDRCDTLMQSFLSDGFDEDEAERDNFAVRVTGPDDP